MQRIDAQPQSVSHPKLPVGGHDANLDKLRLASAPAAGPARPPMVKVKKTVESPLVMYIRLGTTTYGWKPVCRHRSRARLREGVGTCQAGWLDSFAFWRLFIKGLLAGHHAAMGAKLLAVRLNSESATKRWLSLGGTLVKDPDGSMTVELPDPETLTEDARDAIVRDGGLSDVREGFWAFQLEGTGSDGKSDGGVLLDRAFDALS